MAAVEGFDDFGVVDALEVEDAEVAMAELALDDDERHALVGHIDGMSVAQLMRGEPSANASTGRHAAQVGVPPQVTIVARASGR